MKKRFLLKTMLLLCALVAGSSSVWATDYVKVTSANDLVAGDVYVIAEISDNTTKYLVTGYGTKLANTTSGFTVSNNTITTSTASPLEFTLGTVTSGNNTYYTLKYSSNDYLTYSSSTNFGTATSTSANSAQWAITPSTNAYRITNVGTSTRYIGRNGSNIGAYSTSNSYPNCYLFKKQASNKIETSLAWSATSAEVYTDNNSPSLPTLSTISPAAISTGVTYNSTNTNVATINASGVVTIVNPGTTTIQAIYEEDNTYDGAVASYTLNVYGVFSGISALHTAIASAPYNTGTGSKAKITFTDAIVTYVNGNYAYIIDENGNGAVINQTSHGFTAGKIINGTVTGATLCVYSSGATVIKNVTSTTDGLTLTDGSVTTETKAINAVTAANQSMMVKFESVIYNSATSSFTDNTNSIVYVDKFSVNPTLSNGGKYDVTGLLIMDDGVLKVAPIAAGGIVSKLINPTSQWKNGEEALTSVTINKAAGNTSFTFETNSDGAVTYSSTNTNVATIAANGAITPVGYGTTTIKANTAATNDYNADEKSFTLKVGDASVDVIEIGNVTFAGNSSYQNWTNVSGLTTPATYAGQSMTGQTYIQIRNQSPAGIVTTASAGRVKKISVTWAGSNTNNRYLTIYGKNTAYSSSTELYDNDEKVKGDELGTITFTTNDTSGELTIDNEDDYGFIGIKASGAMYIGVLAIEWEEDKLPVPIASSGYSTIAKDVAFDCANLPEGLKAYKVPNISSTAVTLEEVTTAVAAGTGLILVGQPKTAYSIPLVASGTDISSTNKLHAAVTATDVAANEVYILKGGKFCKVTGASTVPAGKAYLLASDVPASAPELVFDFGGEVTGINSIANSQELKANSPIYNLAGQRVAQPTKGLYIVNGKKVVIK